MCQSVSSLLNCGPYEQFGKYFGTAFALIFERVCTFSTSGTSTRVNHGLRYIVDDIYAQNLLLDQPVI